MTDGELRHVEATLGLKLPAAYVRLMRRFPKILEKWPGQDVEEEGKPFSPARSGSSKRTGSSAVVPDNSSSSRSNSAKIGRTTFLSSAVEAMRFIYATRRRTTRMWIRSPTVPSLLPGPT